MRPFGLDATKSAFWCVETLRGPGNLKGLEYIPHGKTEMTGISATDVAREICHHFDIDYELMGMGSTLRECCDNTIAYLS